MSKILGPAGFVLAGFTFICLCAVLAASAAEMPSNLPDLQSEFKESISMRHNSEFTPQSLPSKEKISLEGSHSARRISDLKAVNAVRVRDIVCNEVQNGDPNAMGLMNSLDVSVTGRQEESEKAWPEEKREDDVEKVVDNALNASLESSGNYEGSELERLGNNLDIDVHGISVSAINTVKGGSAVATSNIIIKPVQIIICPSEVEEKLK
jgi:hypothetical protein